MDIKRELIELENFLNYMSSVLCRSDRTITEYRYDVKCFLEYARKNIEICHNVNYTLKLLEQLEPRNIYDYMNAQNGKKSNSSKARTLSALRSFFKYLENVNLLQRNIMTRIKSPSVKQNIPVSLTLTESVQLLNKVNETKDQFYRVRNNCIITLFINCGLRLSELIYLTVRDVESNRIVIKGKGDKERAIYLNPSAASSIAKWLAVRQEHTCPYLFTTKRDTHMSKTAVQAMVKGYFKIMDLDETKYSVHKLRHTAATLMYQYGKTDLLVLQRFLGHASVSTTQIYTHVNDMQLQSAAIAHPLSAL